MKAWLQQWWILLISITFVITGALIILPAGLITGSSAQWTLSSLIQGGAALFGIFFVALSLLWNRANQEQAKLSGLFGNYVSGFAVNTEFVGNMQQMFLEIGEDINAINSDGEYKKSEQEVLHQLYKSFLILRRAYIIYFGYPWNNFDLLKQAEADKFGVEEANYQKEGRAIYKEASRLISNEVSYFEFLDDFASRLTVFIDGYTTLPAVANNSMLNTLNVRMRTQDRIWFSLVSIATLRIFNSKSILLFGLWLGCILLSIIVLASSDNISDTTLQYAVFIPMMAGIIAIGLTLNLGYNILQRISRS